MLLGVAQGQDALTSRSIKYNFEPFKISGFSQQGDITYIQLYSLDKNKVGNFEIPTSSLLRFKYDDSTHITGHVESLLLTREEDFKYASELCLKGMQDARANYKLYRASATGTLFLSILSPVLGLACAIPASLTPPRIENLGLPNVDMLHEDIYFQAYQKEAWRKKNVRNWMNFGIGFGIHIGILFTVLSFVH